MHMHTRISGIECSIHAAKIANEPWSRNPDLKKINRKQGEDIKLQLKGEKNRYVTIVRVSQNEVTLSEPEGNNISVPLSNVAGFTTDTNWYRYRKCKVVWIRVENILRCVR